MTTSSAKRSATTASDPISLRNRVLAIDEQSAANAIERAKIIAILLEQGFVLVDEPTPKEPLADTPQDWKKGDVLTFVHTGGSQYFTVGKDYVLEEDGIDDEGEVRVKDDDHDQHSKCFGLFKWKCRP